MYPQSTLPISLSCTHDSKTPAMPLPRGSSTWSNANGKGAHLSEVRITSGFPGSVTRRHSSAPFPSSFASSGRMLSATRTDSLLRDDTSVVLPCLASSILERRASLGADQPESADETGDEGKTKSGGAG